MNDAERKDNWHWEDGSTTAYRNWLPKEPSGGSERCATMVSSGQWNDIYCEIHYPMYYVCKKAHEGKYNIVPSTQSVRRHMRESSTVPITMYVRWHMRVSTVPSTTSVSKKVHESKLPLSPVLCL